MAEKREQSARDDSQKGYLDNLEIVGEQGKVAASKIAAMSGQPHVDLVTAKRKYSGIAALELRSSPLRKRRGRIA